MATVVEIREIREKSGKMKKVEMIKEKSRNLRKKEESQGILICFPNVKVLTLLKFNLESSFYRNAVSRSHGKFSEVREKSGKGQG